LIREIDIAIRQGFQASFSSVITSDRYKLDGLNSSLIDGDVRDEYAWAYQESYHQEEKISQGKFTIFQLVEGKWQRSNITWLLKAYPKVEIQSALEKIGFTEVRIHNFRGDLATLENERSLCFLCRK